MKRWQGALLAAIVMLLTSGSALAAGTFCTDLKQKFPLLPIRCPTNQGDLVEKVNDFCANRNGLACTWYKNKNNAIVSAPEIDAASGTSAIALLTGIVLLIGERTRARRSSDVHGNSVN
jgi:hypothetical protein